MLNLNLKGLWIPVEILSDKILNDKEKYIYSLIIFLSQEKGQCYCANSTISELLDISITQSSKIINSLKTKGYIDIKMKYKENSKQIETRTLIPMFKNNTTYLTKVKYPSTTKLQYPIEEKFKDNKENNKNKNINNKYREGKKLKSTIANFEQRDYDNFDFTTLYANVVKDI
ncbi:MAG: helix-turn-helix domain-containing protein [Clostridia bacterium]|nr:helix-turn-helix domain-containing protein [Clostridia bacterium]